MVKNGVFFLLLKIARRVIERRFHHLFIHTLHKIQIIVIIDVLVFLSFQFHGYLLISLIITKLFFVESLVKILKPHEM